MKLTRLAPALLLLSACSSVRYDDPGKTETLTIDYGSTDLQTLAGDMVESLVSSPALNYLENPGKTEDKRIIMYVGDVENRTSEHIDTQAITDKIQTQLLKSGKFRFVAADQGQAEIGDQVRFQQGSGRVRTDMMREFGKQLGADMILYGTLRSIEKRKGSSVESGLTRKQDVYYQFVLRAVNIDTGEIIWQDEAELRKTSSQGLFGRI
ncbi:MAG TPA: penicillin-binding protein activator LpoB [Planctomycetes bacterium]|nr:penicillin-binding protein activator LpoB [Planctomycetota bacterium]